MALGELVEEVQVGQAVGETGVGEGVLGIDVEGRLVVSPGLVVGGPSALHEQGAAPEVVVVGVGRPRLAGSCRPLQPDSGEAHVQRFQHLGGYLLLHRQHLLLRAMPLLRPDPETAPGVGELGGDAELAHVPAHGAGENVAHSELPSYLTRIGVGLELEGHAAGGHAQLRQARQAVEDLLGETLAEVGLTSFGAEVGERQDGDGDRRAGCRADRRLGARL